jgi:polar amino acid transport system substrate-binding protein
MKRTLSVVASLLVCACATVGGPEAPTAAKAELAPTGTLRVALITINPLFVTQGTPPGEIRGIAVDIANRLAGRIGVPMKPVLYPSAAALIESTGKREWDITFLPITPERATLMNFTAPYMYTESTFLVPAGSSAKTIEDLDQRGKTIVALSRTAHEAWLKSNLKAATLITASTPAVAMQMMKEGKVDAPIAMAVIKVRPAADAFAYEFIDQLKASGAIQEIVEREKLLGVRAAK